MPRVRITNLRIIEKISNSEFNTDPYFYMIFDNDKPDEDKQKVFFAFGNKVKKGWEKLSDNWDKLQEIEFDYFSYEKDGKTINRVVNITDCAMTTPIIIL